MIKVILTAVLLCSVNAMASEASCVAGLDSYKAFLVNELGLETGKQSLSEKLNNEEVVGFIVEWERLIAERDRLRGEIKRMTEDDIKDDIQVELTQAKFDLHQVMGKFQETGRANDQMLTHMGLELRTNREGGAELVDVDHTALNKQIYFEDKGWSNGGCGQSEVSNTARFTYVISTEAFNVTFLDTQCGHGMAELKTVLMYQNVSCTPEERSAIYKTYDAGI